eukprot:3832334-Alexandrium_andersonii.AAC.1
MLQQPQEAKARGVEHPDTVVIGLNGPRKGAAARFALTSILHESASRDLVKPRELLCHQHAHGQVGRQFALKVRERDPLAALLT